MKFKWIFVFSPTPKFAGETVSFDNSRVLHGRKGFTVSGVEETVRHLESTFVDIDEINSKRRILKSVLGLDKYMYV